VAAEVKQLASQTAVATHEIARHVGEIQASSGDAVTAIEAIARLMQDVNATTTSIAASVSQQGSATMEIRPQCSRRRRGNPGRGRDHAGIVARRRRSFGRRRVGPRSRRGRGRRDIDAERDGRALPHQSRGRLTAILESKARGVPGGQHSDAVTQECRRSRGSRREPPHGSILTLEFVRLIRNFVVTTRAGLAFIGLRSASAVPAAFPWPDRSCAWPWSHRCWYSRCWPCRHCRRVHP